MRDDSSKLLPLAPATLHILVALAAEEMHGYGIMQEVQKQSDGRYKLGPGTLYDNLQRLMAQRLVEDAGRRDGDSDPRRKYYRLTATGRRLLTEEVTRLEGVVRQAKLHLQATELRRA